MGAVSTSNFTVGDTLVPLNAIIEHTSGPVDISADTIKFLMKSDDGLGTSVIAATTTGITRQPTQIFTAVISVNSGVVFCNGHGVLEGQQLLLYTTSALPGGLLTSTRYYAVQVTPDAFGLARFPQGSPITLTDNGTGQHTFTVVGSVQYDRSGFPATAGRYRAWFQRISGSATQTYPQGDDYIAIVLNVST
jgi:hypothetical protein